MFDNKYTTEDEIKIGDLVMNTWDTSISIALEVYDDRIRDKTLIYCYCFGDDSYWTHDIKEYKKLNLD